MRSFPFLLREALVNLKRHGLMTAAAITTIAVSLALLGGFLLTFYQVNTATRRALEDFEMRVFCRSEIAEDNTAAVRAAKKAGRRTNRRLSGARGDQAGEEVRSSPGTINLARLRKRLESLDGVQSVVYLSKERIWKEQTREYPIDTAGIPNLMNDTFVVKLADPRKAAAIAREVKGWHAEVDDVSLPDDEMGRVLRLAGFVRSAGIAGGIVLLLGALVVVSNTIRISVFARRREIKIMQLVGAAPWFIRLPLLIEGLLHGLAGGALAAAALLVVASYVSQMIRESAAFLLPYGGVVDLPRCALALVVLGALIGALGSLVSIRRYLHAL